MPTSQTQELPNTSALFALCEDISGVNIENLVIARPHDSVSSFGHEVLTPSKDKAEAESNTSIFRRCKTTPIKGHLGSLLEIFRKPANSNLLSRRLMKVSVWSPGGG
ncbi:hypothetical protein ACTXT7_003288 [Hymenolepis weldensis]